MHDNIVEFPLYSKKSRLNEFENDNSTSCWCFDKIDFKLVGCIGVYRHFNS